MGSAILFAEILPNRARGVERQFGWLLEMNQKTLVISKYEWKDQIDSPYLFAWTL